MVPCVNTTLLMLPIHSSLRKTDPAVTPNVSRISAVPSTVSFSSFSSLVSHACDKLNLTSPVVAPPTQVLSKVPVGHVSCAALTQRSHRPLEMLMVAPASVADRSKRDPPFSPTVDVGDPPHFWIEPAMPPQMERMATLVSCVSSWLVEWLALAMRRRIRGMLLTLIRRCRSCR